MAGRLCVCSAALAVAIASAAAGQARAEEIAGWILKVNRAEETITLNNFQSFRIPVTLMPVDLMIGSTVKVFFDRSDAPADAKNVTKLVVICQSFGAPCSAPNVIP